MRAMGVELSAEQVSQMVATHDTRRSGGIDFSDFLAMVLQQGVTDGPRFSGAHVRKMRQTFEMFDAARTGACARHDTDSEARHSHDGLLGSGALDTRDFGSAVRTLSPSLGEDDMRRLLSAVERDASGRIGLAEWYSAASSLEPWPLDVQAGPVAPVAHAAPRKPAGLTVQQVRDARTAFNRFDADGSGQPPLAWFAPLTCFAPAQARSTGRSCAPPCAPWAWSSRPTRPASCWPPTTPNARAASTLPTSWPCCCSRAAATRRGSAPRAFGSCARCSSASTPTAPVRSCARVSLPAAQLTGRARIGTIDTRELSNALRHLGLSLSADELRRTFVSMDRDRSGSIDLAEWIVSLSGMADRMQPPSMEVAAPAQPGALSVKQVREAAAVFRRFDTDGSGRLGRERTPACSRRARCAGSIDGQELRTAMRSMGVELSADQTSKLLATYDTKRSGSIDFADFLAMVVQQGGGAAAASVNPNQVRQWQQAFQRFDTNRSGAPRRRAGGLLCVTPGGPPIGRRNDRPGGDAVGSATPRPVAERRGAAAPLCRYGHKPLARNRPGGVDRWHGTHGGPAAAAAAAAGGAAERAAGWPGAAAAAVAAASPRRGRGLPPLRRRRLR